MLHLIQNQEIPIITLLASGKDNPGIINKLFMTPGTHKVCINDEIFKVDVLQFNARLESGEPDKRINCFEIFINMGIDKVETEDEPDAISR